MAKPERKRTKKGESKGEKEREKKRGGRHRIFEKCSSADTFDGREKGCWTIYRVKRSTRLDVCVYVCGLTVEWVNGRKAQNRCWK